MTNGEKFIQTFGNATALYDSELDITTIHIDSDWWDAEYKGVDVLDKLRAEIEDYITHSPYIKSFMDCCRLRDDVMQIIDKYRNEVST